MQKQASLNERGRKENLRHKQPKQLLTYRIECAATNFCESEGQMEMDLKVNLAHPHLYCILSVHGQEGHLNKQARVFSSRMKEDLALACFGDLRQVQ